ncbi:uncharacterized protein MYCFIDRAFT_179304 [Pseudocercospora fijiensis CIRAD86]|uniref:Uncharacterized protein n=1 Tax=Pseudocercospora fijiensis (strain CIRAD86) TaxID=383855 RepID=M2YJC2_PSEFD|nr:uncharacterized protein MYCFIDRAFT_179304 [Pseudocercospora fijiensis CIRAD86]EME77825.1 hypothetical protein MYCFIDRAFT_179304 [Pseudocercospora fijiensis CIRAD86]
MPFCKETGSWAMSYQWGHQLKHYIARGCSKPSIMRMKILNAERSSVQRDLGWMWLCGVKASSLSTVDSQPGIDIHIDGIGTWQEAASSPEKYRTSLSFTNCKKLR